MTFAAGVPVTSHDLALRVEEAALRFDRAGRVERGEDALLPDIGVNRSAVAVGSSDRPGALIPLTVVTIVTSGLTTVATAPGKSIVVKTPLFNTKPWRIPSVPANSPAIACVLFALTAVAAAPGTSIVVKSNCAFASPGILRTKPSTTAASVFHDLRTVV